MSILALGAHFDDIELACSGTLIKHVAAGEKVLMLVASDSEYSSPDGELIRDAETALAEGRKGAEIIGAELECLGYKTFELPRGDALQSKLLSIIKSRGIHTLYVHWPYDVHQDHQVLARAALMAGKRVPRYLMYQSNPFSSDHVFNARMYSDISEHFPRKLDSVRAHQSELARVNDSWLEWVEEENKLAGRQIGVTYAERFEAVRYQT